MKPNQTVTSLALILTLLILAGCATRAPDPDALAERGEWGEQRSAVEALERWRLAGRVGIRAPGDSTTANLDWLQRPHYYRLLLSGPFGAGTSILEGRDGQVSLTTNQGRFEAESPEALMEEQLGWALPVSALDHWVRGLPDPDSRHDLDHDDQGFPELLRQDGWEIEYRDWIDTETLWLPRRLIMTFDEIRVTLVVNEWRLEESGE
ncbi:lipoprotein localization factor LolB [Halomonas sp. 1513]|nr:lipoprotein insertase outer membrane protein LolB [Halomonas sp. 1513]APX93702.1 lipoprotein localization factor LolB [Halomonas sp. 1513]